MAKLTLSNLTNLNNQTSAVNTINNNSDLVEAAIENTLSRDGTSPNEMNADLDMNGNQILNLPAPVSSTDVVRKVDLDTAIATVEAGIVSDDSVTNAKLANMAQNTIKGRISASTGDPEDLTPSDVRTIINVEDGAQVNDDAAGLLTKLLTVDGASSGLDADLLQGTTPSAFGLSLIDDGDASTARSTLGLVIGTNVQAHSSDLDTIAGFTPTKGNILVGDGSDWVALTVGADGTVLTADSGEPAGVTWSGTAVSAPTDAQYITAASNATLSAERVATNTSTVSWDFSTPGQAEANVIDDSITLAKLEHGTQGDVLYYGASGTPARLAAGTAGQVLETQGAGANPHWVTPGWRLIESGSVSNAASATVDISGYDLVQIWVTMRPNTDGQDIHVRMSQNGGSSFLNGAADYSWQTRWGGDYLADTSDSEIELSTDDSGFSNGADDAAEIIFSIRNPNGSGNYKTLIWHGVAARPSDDAFDTLTGMGRLIGNTNAIDTLRFYATSGNITMTWHAIGMNLS